MKDGWALLMLCLRKEGAKVWRNQNDGGVFGLGGSLLVAKIWNREVFVLSLRANLHMRMQAQETPQQNAHGASPQNNRMRNIFFGIGLTAFVVMCFTFDVSFSTLWSAVCKAGYWLVAILVLWAGLYMMNALSWRVIIRGSGECPIPFWKLAKITVSGFALNFATPVGLLGGEPYRIMEARPYIGVDRASSSVLLFAMMHIFSHFWYWMVSIFTYLTLAMTGYLPLGGGMGTVLMAMFVFCSGGIYLFVKGYRNGMVVKLVHLVGRIPGLRKWAGNFHETHREDLQKIDSQISALHSQSRRAFAVSFALEFIGRMMMSLEVFFILMIFDSGTGNVLLTFLYSYLILSFTSLFANLLCFMPMQLGGREGGFAMSVAAMGMTSEIGIFVSIICRVRELFWAGIGILLMKVGNSVRRNN